MPSDITNGKTYPQLDEETLPIVGTDVLAIYRGPGPLAQIPASGLLDYIETGVDPLVTAAETARDEAVAAETAALGAASAAEVSADLAQDAASEAELARLTAGFYPDARANVPRGIVSTSGLVAGSGGANGTFALAFSGGNFTVAPSGTFTVASGALTSVSITGPGLYIGASPTAPTAVLTASAGLTGASVVLDAGFLAGSGEYYWTDDATATNLMALYQNVAGTATATSPLVNLTKSLTSAVVPCTVGGSANAITMTPKTGFSVVSAGVDQEFTGFAAATNSSAGLTLAIAGVNGGAATEVVLPQGVLSTSGATAVPARALRANYPVRFRWDSTITKYVLTEPVFLRQPSFVNLTLVSGSTGNALLGRLSSPVINLPGDFTNVNFSITVDADKEEGGPSLTLYDFDGTTVLLSASTIRLKNGVVATDADLWKAGDTLVLQRQASGLFYLVETPTTAITTLTQELQTLVLQTPSTSYPVSIQRVADRVWVVKHNSVQYQAAYADLQMDQNYVTSVMYNMARAQSQSGSVAANVFSVNSDWAFIQGDEYRYSQFLSNELAGGVFDREQPSVGESEPRLGIVGQAANTYVQIGVGKGYLINVAADFTLMLDGGATDAADLAVGEIVNCESAIFRVRSDAMYGNDVTPSQAGELIYEHEFSSGPTRYYSQLKVGRELQFSTGVSQIVEGDIITGATSGTVATVVSVPDRRATGSWGSNRAGYIYVVVTSGTDFTPGELLREGATTKATCVASLGPDIGELNYYGVLCNFTTVKYLKVEGYPAVEVGLEAGQITLIPGGAAPPIDVSVQGYHPAMGTAPYTIRKLHIPNGPRTPPGDYSLCTTTKLFGDDRVGGNRKVIVNASSGTVGIQIGGVYESEYYVSYELGDLV
jgi:hypothetical protein